MAIQQLIVRTDPSQRQISSRVALDGRRYRLVFRYLLELDAWTLAIYSDGDALLVAGCTVKLGIDLLAPFRHLDVPPGQLFAFDTSKPQTPDEPVDVEPGEDAFDGRVLMLYRPVAEVVG